MESISIDPSHPHSYNLDANTVESSTGVRHFANCWVTTRTAVGHATLHTVEAILEGYACICRGTERERERLRDMKGLVTQ